MVAGKCRLGRWLSLQVIMNRTETLAYGSLVLLLTVLTIHTVNVEQERPENRERICATLPQPHPDCL
jgi:hypothetical protein